MVRGKSAVAISPFWIKHPQREISRRVYFHDTADILSCSCLTSNASLLQPARPHCRYHCIINLIRYSACNLPPNNLLQQPTTKQPVPYVAYQHLNALHTFPGYVCRLWTNKIRREGFMFFSVDNTQ